MTTRTPPPPTRPANHRADQPATRRGERQPSSHALDDVASSGSGALARVVDGRLTVFALRPTAGVAPSAPGQPTARLTALQHVVQALPATAQLVLDTALPDAAAYRRRHAAATAAEPLPRLRALGHALRAWLRDAPAPVELAGPCLWLVVGRPPAPGAGSGDLPAALARAGFAAERVAGADLLALLSAMTTRRPPGDPLPPELDAGPEETPHAP
jgi:hypothetical protein